MKIYYYYHPESDSLWSSYLPPDEELGDDFDADLTSEISKEHAEKLRIKLGMDIIKLEE